MLRNQTLSTDLQSGKRYDHQSSPRKAKSYLNSGVFQPTLLYRPKYQIARLGSPEYQWIGKKLIPWSGQSLNPYIWQHRIKFLPEYNDYISEYEIAVRAYPHSYRIIYIENKLDGNIKFISRPEIHIRPGRMNILLTRDNTIQQVAYF